MFQPAEEGGAGGKLMVDEGVLDGVDGIHGAHVMPDIPAGVIASKVGHPLLPSMHCIILERVSLECSCLAHVCMQPRYNNDRPPSSNVLAYQQAEVALIIKALLRLRGGVQDVSP